MFLYSHKSQCQPGIMLLNILCSVSSCKRNGHSQENRSLRKSIPYIWAQAWAVGRLEISCEGKGVHLFCSFSSSSGMVYVEKECSWCPLSCLVQWLIFCAEVNLLPPSLLKLLCNLICVASQINLLL
jgi:hypothetical protein